jgi:hypothetical protein
MNIYIPHHTLERAEERGTTQSEIEETIRTGVPGLGKLNRQTREKVFPFGTARNGKWYAEKQVRVVFVEENETIFTVTVYVFYGQFTNLQP